MTVAAEFTFLTPRAAVLGVLLVVPLAALVVAARRVARIRGTLGLEAPPAARRRVREGLLVAIGLLVVLAAMQPAVRTERPTRARTDAQAFVVVDTSRSMAAAGRPGGERRLARAKRAAIAAAAELGDVPVGLATLTDRVLPLLFPTADRAAFDSAVEALTIEDPPPRAVSTVATTFGALGALGTQGFFPANVHKRAAIVVSDGESRPYDSHGLIRGLAAHGIALAAIGVGRGSDRVYRTDGKPEAAYRPDPGGAALALRDLGDETPARLRRSFGGGPTSIVGVEPRTTSLAPVPALLALVPLLMLLGVASRPRLGRLHRVTSAA